MTEAQENVGTVAVGEDTSLDAGRPFRPCSSCSSSKLFQLSTLNEFNRSAFESPSSGVVNENAPSCDITDNLLTELPEHHTDSKNEQSEAKTKNKSSLQPPEYNKGASPPKSEFAECKKSNLNNFPSVVCSCSWMQSLNNMVNSSPASQCSSILRLEDLLLPGSHNAATWNLRHQTEAYGTNETGHSLLQNDGEKDTNDILGLDFKIEHPDLTNYLSSKKRLSKWVASRVIEPWAKCQVKSIKSQLEMGVRYFDLRIAIRQEENSVPAAFPGTKKRGPQHMNNGRDIIVDDRTSKWSSTQDGVGFNIVHGLNARELLSEVLLQVRNFLQKHPFEIVLLDIVHLYGFKTSQHNAALMSLFQSILGPLIVSPTLCHTTINSFSAASTGRSKPRFFRTVQQRQSALPTLNDLWAYVDRKLSSERSRDENKDTTTGSNNEVSTRLQPRVFVFLYEEDCETKDGLDFDGIVLPRLKYIHSSWLRCSSPSDLFCAAFSNRTNYHSSHRTTERLYVLQYVLTPETWQVVLGIVLSFVVDLLSIFMLGKRIGTRFLSLLELNNDCIASLVNSQTKSFASLLSTEQCGHSKSDDSSFNVLLIDGWDTDIDSFHRLMTMIFAENFKRVTQLKAPESSL